MFVVLLMVAVCWCWLCVFLQGGEWTPEVLSELQHGGISNGTHMYSAGTGECLYACVSNLSYGE